jgi:hypothetical protein
MSFGDGLAFLVESHRHWPTREPVPIPDRRELPKGPRQRPGLGGSLAKATTQLNAQLRYTADHAGAYTVYVYNVCGPSCYQRLRALRHAPISGKAAYGKRVCAAVARMRQPPNHSHENNELNAVAPHSNRR